MSKQTAKLLMIIAAVLWGTNSFCIRMAEWDAIGTAWARALGSVVIVAAYLWFRRAFALTKWRRQLASGLFFAGSNLMYTLAVKYTTVANATLLIFGFPIISMVIDFFANGKKPSKAESGVLTLGLSGLVVLMIEKSSISLNLGDLLAIGAATSIALHIFCNQGLNGRESGTTILISQLIPAMVLPWFIQAPSMTDPPMQIMWLAGLAVGSAIPYTLWGQAIIYVKGHVAGAILALEVVVALGLAGLFLNEELLDPTLLLGGAMIVTAALLTLRLREEHS